MGKLDELKRAAGDNVVESAARREMPAIAPTTLAGINPARMERVVRSKVALEIPLDRIDRDPDQPREEFGEDALARLADSIRARGLLQPVRVRWSEELGKYVLIAGERRWRASGMAGLATITCIVHEGELSTGERLALQVTENLLREDLNAIERAKAYRTLMSLNGWSGNQLAKELGIAQSGVAQTLALLALPEPVQGQVEQGNLPPSIGYELSKLDDPGTQQEVAARILADDLTRDEAVTVVRQAAGRPSKKRGRGEKGKRNKITERTLRAAGCKLTVENRRGLDTELIAAALREAVALVEAELRGDGADAA
jgi:ParB family chromosome partitioning protein